jgi:hypothetical protein
MSAAQRDVSGVFRSFPGAHKSPRRSPRVVVSANGVTFASDSYVAPFTEVQVRVKGTKHRSLRQGLNCQGVVVDCRGNNSHDGYKVSVAFLNAPPTLRHQLRDAQEPAARRIVLHPPAKLGRASWSK